MTEAGHGVSLEDGDLGFSHHDVRAEEAFAALGELSADVLRQSKRLILEPKI